MQIDRQPEHGIAGGFNFPPQRVIGREVAALDALAKPGQVAVHRPEPSQDFRTLLWRQIVRVHSGSVTRWERSDKK